MKKNEKIIIIFLIILIIFINIVIFLIYKSSYVSDNEKIIINSNETYEIYQNDKIIKILDSYDEALKYAKKYENSSIKKTGEYKWIYDSNPPYEVYQNYNLLKKFINYNEALNYAKKYENSYIFYRKSNTFIWDNQYVPIKYKIKNVPFILQYPELARGCEVTSLAMLLKYKGYNIDKLELAKNIKKEPFFIDEKKIYNGNPNKGFLGDIYTFKNNGYGVYIEPLYELLKKYVGDMALNITGINLDDIYYYISNNFPVMVITNTRFKKLPQTEFSYINTKEGKIKITYKEHCVLITGYDEKYVYFNDPLYKNEKKALKKDFEEAFLQMGSQALTYVS